MAIHSKLQLITFIVFGFLLSNSIATTTLDGCESEYCAGETISYTCTSNSETILITLGDPNGTYILNEWFNGSSDIGEVESTEEGVWYNKTSDTTINVWFEASMSFNGSVFECSDVDNDTTINCTVAVNSIVPSITSLEIDDPMYCENVTFIWQIMGDDTCLQNFAVEVTPDGNSSMDTIVPKTDRSISLFEDAIGNQQRCITVAPRTAIGTGPVSPMRCVTFDVPQAVQPNNIRWRGIDFQDDKEEVAIIIWWMMPDRSRPNVMWYYVSANITETDNGGTSGSGSGDDDDDDMMNEFLSYTVSGGTTMIQFANAVIGKVYSLTIIAENCYGNSTVATYSFTVERPTPTTTSTMDMTATMTMSPSPTPTEDTGLATYIIVIIAVVGGVIVAAILAFVIALLICCCVCGGTLICCAAAGSKKQDRSIEMKTGTHL